jgi:hypothetical protein
MSKPIPPLVLETCPTCGQEIPPDRVEEISGKIAARERDRALAITAQVEQRYAAEKAQADAKAKADLEQERQQGAAREARAREEARADAEKLVREKQLESEKAQAENAAKWQLQLQGAESARKSAEQAMTATLAQMNELREANAKSLETAKAEAEQREIQIRDEAKLAADAAASQRIEAAEAAQKQSEASLNAKVNEAQASLRAAEQKEATFALQLDEMKNAKDAEIAKVREEAEAEALRVRQAVTAEAEARLGDTLRAHETAAAEANARASEAERKISALTEQHASEIEKSLGEQREIMEKAKDQAVNAERSRAFEESQKLSTKVNELQRALEKKTTEELGEGAEVDLYEALRAEFPDDKITQIPRGVAGADVRQIVMLRGENCGTILYDSKNHKQFRHEHVTKLRTDQLAEKAEHAVLSTHKFPQGKYQIHIQEGVILANPARVLSIATILRQQLKQLHTLRLSSVERESKTAALYEFINSAHCSDLLNRVNERADHLIGLQEKEIKWHVNNWKNQGEAIRAIQKAKADVANRIASIIGAAEDDSALSEAS